MSKLYKGLLIAISMITGIVIGPAAWAQGWPTRPISLMVGFAPGGGTDVTARLFAQKLTSVLGQPVIVENRPGAAGNIAAENVVKAAPDGYHILMIASGTFINNVLTSRPRYSVTKDLAPISFVTISPLVLVAGPTVKARSVPELLEEIRAKPKKFTYSGDGVGGTQQLTGELFSSMTGAKLLFVPFKGSSDATAAVAAGQVDISFPSTTAAAPLLQSGKVRALAVTSAHRSSLLPDVPTLSELGLSGFDVVGWFALMGPNGLPRPIIDKINSALAEVARQPDVKEALGKQGLEVQLNSPEEFAVYLREQASIISKVAKDANIKID